MQVVVTADITGGVRDGTVSIAVPAAVVLAANRTVVGVTCAPCVAVKRASAAKYPARGGSIDYLAELFQGVVEADGVGMAR